MGNNVKGKKKPLIKCGESGTYGDLMKKRCVKKGDKPGNPSFNRDHIPPKELMIQLAKDYAKKARIKFTSDMRTAIINEIAAFGIPTGVHRTHSPTYGRSVKQLKDIGYHKDLGASARNDAKKVLEGLDKNGSPACKKKYEQAVKKFDNMSHDDHMKLVQDIVKKLNSRK